MPAWNIKMAKNDEMKEALLKKFDEIIKKSES